MENKRKLGREQEERACSALRQAGYIILHKNYRCRRGEIDLIADHRGTLVFIEVKYRKRLSSGHPEEAVTKEKQRRISMTASWYMMEKGIPMEHPCRFDVVAMTPETIRLYQNAFDYIR